VDLECFYRVPFGRHDMVSILRASNVILDLVMSQSSGHVAGRTRLCLRVPHSCYCLHPVSAAGREKDEEKKEKKKKIS
jgi:hypothetical protein